MALLDNVKIRSKDAKRFDKELKNWAILQPVLSTYTEDDLKRAMLFERQTKNRLNILQRLYSRFSKVRADRERREILYGEVVINEAADNGETKTN